MRRRGLPPLVLIALLFSAGMAWSAQEPARVRAGAESRPADVSPRVAALRRQIEDVGRLLRTLMVSSDYSGPFKDYVESCQARVLALGSTKYQDSGLRAEGELTAIITILPDGKVHGIRIHRSSGYAELDALLAETVREAAPFAPFPEALAKDYDRLALTLQFRYRSDPVPEPSGAAR